MLLCGLFLIRETEKSLQMNDNVAGRFACVALLDRNEKGTKCQRSLARVESADSTVNEQNPEIILQYHLVLHYVQLARRVLSTSFITTVSLV